jgi:hypothetical protein
MAHGVGNELGHEQQNVFTNGGGQPAVTGDHRAPGGRGGF